MAGTSSFGPNVSSAPWDDRHRSRFATPAASDGKLFLATGQTVEAYTIANPTTAPAPVVSGISPSSGPAAGATSVTITGTNFSRATAVKFGSSLAGAFTVVSATQVTATAPAGTGTVDVTISTAGGTSAASNSDKYTYVPAATNLLQNPLGAARGSPSSTSTTASPRSAPRPGSTTSGRYRSARTRP